MTELTFKDIRKAQNRINALIHRTPVLTSQTLNHQCQTEFFFKCENFQKAGAFKMRGAANAVFSLNNREASLGVATHSSGNHAAALALAAKWRGIPAYVVMPANAPRVKREAAAGYGAQIFLCEPTQAAREQNLAQVIEQTGAHFVHPYNDLRVIAGQGTAALELCEQVPDLDIIITPVGGGGLLSGTALAAAAISASTAVFAAEPKGADDAFRSLQAGHIVPSDNPDTIADGLLTSLGDLTFPIIRKYVRQIVIVSEDGIKKAMRLIWERMKIIVEPSAAVPLAPFLEPCRSFSGKRVGVILSGGNVDFDHLPWN